MDDARRRGVVDALSSPHAVLRPLSAGAFELGEGFWSRHQQLNSERSLEHGLARLETAGNLDNLRNAANGGGPFRGPVFMDSDVYKWLEAAAWELGRSPDAELRRHVADVIAIVAAAQESDGYINSHVQITDPSARWADLAHGHELYCIGHLVQAGIAMSRANGDDTLLHIAERAVGCANAVFGEGRRVGVPGHPEIESALVELYRHTGNSSYLQLASFFLDHRGRGLIRTGRFYEPAYYQDRVPIRESSVIEGHAVRAVYLMTGVVDVYLETGEEALLAAAARQWGDMIGHKQYITGAIGSRAFSESFGDPYELPSATAYAETCAAIGCVFWNWRMLLATGESRFADQIEWLLFNAVLCGIGLDGTTFFYENPLSSRGEREREPWFACACCPPNLMRLMASLGHYFATCDAHGIQVQQFASGTLTNGDAVVGVETDYPWSGTVTIDVRTTPDTEWALSLRLPAWCIDPTVALNGAIVEAARSKGYATTTRRWVPGDVVVLTLPMPPQFMRGHPNIEATRASVAITRGPIVYCIESCDQPQDVADMTVTIDPRLPLQDVWRPDFLGGAVTLTGSGYARSNAEWDSLYRRMDDGSRERQTIDITAVPYFLWGNRDRGSMNVWVPIEDQETR
jgi:uncharacterized protein